MKTLIRIAILCFVVFLFIYLKDHQATENKPLKSPVKPGTALPVENIGIGSAIPQTSRPEKGISTFIGQDVDKLIEKHGQPDRVEPSVYGYDWWIYKNNGFFMVGVTKEETINQIYTADEQIDILPFEINQALDEIYRFAIIGAEIDVQVEDSIYTFTLNNEDLMSRPVIIYQDLFAQLYIDEIEGKLAGVRFIDPVTIVLHQPYEMMYMGELLAAKPLSSSMQFEVNETTKRQIFELTNFFREKEQLMPLRRTYQLTQFAQENSKQLAFEKMLIENEATPDHLSKRLKDAQIEHRKAEENTAFDYHDAIEAVHGWMNSKVHRKTMLTKDFTHLGVGVYGNYYTQTFIKSTDEDNRAK